MSKDILDILSESPTPPSNSFRVLSWIIFSSRWLQAPLYFGLIIAQFFYVYLFVEELIVLIFTLSKIDENTMMLTVLGLIDVVMISNLLIMVIIGGYETFVSRLGIQAHPDLPEWLNQVNANTMKIKLAMALIGISSIHLLKTFINVDLCSTKKIIWEVTIHMVFLFSALALAYTSKLSKDTGDEK